MLISACTFSGTHPKVLDEAQRLMDSDPAAALSKLNELDLSDLPDSSAMARWALLYSEALAANRFSAPSDTIINIAIDYYGRYKQSPEYFKAVNLKELSDSLEIKDALATAHFLQKEKEFFLYKERIKRKMWMLGGLVLLLVAIFAIGWMYQRLKMQSLMNDALMTEASGLKRLADDSRVAVSRLETKLQELLINRFTLIDTLCQTYYETQGTKAERKAIVDKVKNEIESIRSDSFAEMEKAVNDCRDNLLEAVIELYPSMKSEDYQLYVFIACGLSTRTICLLLGETPDVIYKRKSRLKFRLKELADGHNPAILEVF